MLRRVSQIINEENLYPCTTLLTVDENICQEHGVSYMMKMTIKIPRLDVITRILVGVGFTVGGGWL